MGRPFRLLNPELSPLLESRKELPTITMDLCLPKSIRSWFRHSVGRRPAEALLELEQRTSTNPCRKLWAVQDMHEEILAFPPFQLQHLHVCIRLEQEKLIVPANI